MLAPNTLLQNRYLILRPLGQGGTGAVYEATDQLSARVVAIKESHFDSEALRQAFEREARLLGDLRHHALPVVVDTFAERDGWFLVMEFVAGEDLGARLGREGRPFALDDVLRWADQVLDALEYLHGHRPPIVHGDIKPQNLKVTPKGEVKLLDFGFARGHAAQLSRAAGGRGLAGYTPHYAPIEQIQGAGADVRSDLYSLGATMYHLMTGLVPPDALERATRVLKGQPDPLQRADAVNSRVPAAVAEVVHGAMATGADQRPDSAAEMRRALRRAAAHVTLTPEPALVATGTAAAPALARTGPQAGATARQAGGQTSRAAGHTAAAEPVVVAAPSRRAAPALLAGALGVALLAVALYAGFAWYSGGGPADGEGVARVEEALKPPPLPPLQTLEFETVAAGVDGRAAPRKGQARYFVEDLGGVPLEMVEVPAGEFEMGASPGSVPSVRDALVPTSYAPQAGSLPPAPPSALLAVQRKRSRQSPRDEEAEEQEERKQKSKRDKNRDEEPRRQRAVTPRPKPKPAPKPAPKRPQPAKPSPPPAVPAPEPPPDGTELPSRRVATPAYYLSRFEVTQAQWRVVAGWPKVERDLDPDPSEFKGDNLPVENVSWEDAVEFCARLARQTGRPYRLPTEAEWEYACRAGSAAPFAFGRTIGTDLANYDGRQRYGGGPAGVFRRKTLPVGSLKIANAFGLHDMHGNVWEWCLDPWHANYSGAPGDAAAWEAGGDPANRPIRGGSWMSKPADCRSTRRVDNARASRNSDVGFRVALPAS